jgi:hypothetical protein
MPPTLQQSNQSFFSCRLLVVVLCFLLSAQQRATADSNVFANDDTGILAKFAQIESFKTSALWSVDTRNGRKTLSRYHYVIVPVWYSDEQQPRAAFDTDAMNAVFARIAAFYKAMSWNKFVLTWNIVNPLLLTGVSQANPTMTQVQVAVTKHVTDTLGLKNPRDYTGVMVMYNPSAAGDLANLGGWATINGTRISLFGRAEYRGALSLGFLMFAPLLLCRVHVP